MKGELVRGRRTNHVVVEHTVIGSRMMDCPVCNERTNHAMLSEGLVMCCLCWEVTINDRRITL